MLGIVALSCPVLNGNRLRRDKGGDMTGEKEKGSISDA